MDSRDIESDGAIRRIVRQVLEEEFVDFDRASCRAVRNTRLWAIKLHRCQRSDVTLRVVHEPAV